MSAQASAVVRQIDWVDVAATLWRQFRALYPQLAITIEQWLIETMGRANR